MENSLKNQLERMSVLMEYQYSKNKSYLLKEQDSSSEEKMEDKFPFRMNRVGGNKIRVQDSQTGDKIDIPSDLMEEFFNKLNSFRKV